jgi:hypothetical protein
MAAHYQHLVTRAIGVDAQPTAAASSPATTEILHLALPGRMLITGSQEIGCTLTWVKDRTARVSADGVGQALVGDRTILYLDIVGRIEGAVSWVGPADVEIRIAAPSAKWQRLQQQFAVLAAMAPGERENLRGYRRIVLDVPDVELSLPDGRKADARIRDVSRSGAAVRSGVAPEIGTLVTLGSTRGKVVRLLDDGFAVQFLRLLPLEWFTPAYVL